VTLTSSSVWAAPSYDFEDMIDTWTVLGVPGLDATPVVEGIPFTYTHDLSDDVDFARGDVVLTGWLELDFTNDLTDDHGSKFGGLLKWDYREYVQLDLDGNPSSVDLGEVDAGQYVVQASVGWLNTYHQLNVTIHVYNALDGTNPLDGSLATTWLDHSRLYGTAIETVPAPSALLLVLLGVGTARFTRRTRA
jgi:hypothetical protein